MLRVLEELIRDEDANTYEQCVDYKKQLGTRYRVSDAVEGITPERLSLLAGALIDYEKSGSLQLANLQDYYTGARKIDCEDYSYLTSSIDSSLDFFKQNSIDLTWIASGAAYLVAACVPQVRLAKYLARAGAGLTMLAGAFGILNNNNNEFRDAAKIITGTVIHRYDMDPAFRTAIDDVAANCDFGIKFNGTVKDYIEQNPSLASSILVKALENQVNNLEESIGDIEKSFQQALTDMREKMQESLKSQAQDKKTKEDTIEKLKYQYRELSGLVKVASSFFHLVGEDDFANDVNRFGSNLLNGGFSLAMCWLGAMGPLECAGKVAEAFTQLLDRIQRKDSPEPKEQLLEELRNTQDMIRAMHINMTRGFVKIDGKLDNILKVITTNDLKHRETLSNIQEQLGNIQKTLGEYRRADKREKLIESCDALVPLTGDGSTFNAVQTATFEDLLKAFNAHATRASIDAAFTASNRAGTDSSIIESAEANRRIELLTGLWNALSAKVNFALPADPIPNPIEWAIGSQLCIQALMEKPGVTNFAAYLTFLDQQRSMGEALSKTVKSLASKGPGSAIELAKSRYIELGNMLAEDLYKIISDFRAAHDISELDFFRGYNLGAIYVVTHPGNGPFDQVHENIYQYFFRRSMPRDSYYFYHSTNRIAVYDLRGIYNIVQYAIKHGIIEIQYQPPVRRPPRRLSQFRHATLIFQKGRLQGSSLQGERWTFEDKINVDYWHDSWKEIAISAGFVSQDEKSGTFADFILYYVNDYIAGLKEDLFNHIEATFDTQRFEVVGLALRMFGSINIHSQSEIIRSDFPLLSETQGLFSKQQFMDLVREKLLKTYGVTRISINAPNVMRQINYDVYRYIDHVPDLPSLEEQMKQVVERHVAESAKLVMDQVQPLTPDQVLPIITMTLNHIALCKKIIEEKQQRLQCNETRAETRVIVHRQQGANWFMRLIPEEDRNDPAFWTAMLTGMSIPLSFFATLAGKDIVSSVSSSPPKKWISQNENSILFATTALGAGVGAVVSHSFFSKQDKRRTSKSRLFCSGILSFFSSVLLAGTAGVLAVNYCKPKNANGIGFLCFTTISALTGLGTSILSGVGFSK